MNVFDVVEFLFDWFGDCVFDGGWIGFEVSGGD